jgi:hypothetical protein
MEVVYGDNYVDISNIPRWAALYVQTYQPEYYRFSDGLGVDGRIITILKWSLEKQSVK